MWSVAFAVRPRELLGRQPTSVRADRGMHLLIGVPLNEGVPTEHERLMQGERGVSRISYRIAGEG